MQMVYQEGELSHLIQPGKVIPTLPGAMALNIIPHVLLFTLFVMLKLAVIRVNLIKMP